MSEDKKYRNIRFRVVKENPYGIKIGTIMSCDFDDISEIGDYLVYEPHHLWIMKRPMEDGTFFEDFVAMSFGDGSINFQWRDDNESTKFKNIDKKDIHKYFDPFVIGESFPFDGYETFTEALEEANRILGRHRGFLFGGVEYSVQSGKPIKNKFQL